MSQKKNKIIEYSVDYRSTDRKATKTPAIIKSSPKNINTTPLQMEISVKKENTRRKTKSADVGTIKISETNKKQLGLYRIFFSGIIMILTIVGIAILLSTMRRTTSVINDSPTYTKYNNYIAPVVMQDPAPFSTPVEANHDMIISSSIWRNIFQKGSEHYKEFDEQGLTLMPLSDVQHAAAELFGPDVVINTSENIFGPFYSYTAGDINFHISAISNLGTFVPYIEEMTEKNNELTLKVSYLSRDDKFLSADDNKNQTPTPIKQMIYKLKLNAVTDKYYISEIENKSN